MKINTRVLDATIKALISIYFLFQTARRARRDSTLQPLSAKRAQEQGWQLVEVWLPEKRRYVCEVHAHPEFKKPFDSVAKVYAWLWEKAKKGDALCIKALTVISNYNTPKTKK